MKSAIPFLLIFIVSCSGYVSNIHRQIDREEKGGRRKVKVPETRDHFAAYRRRRLEPHNDKRPVKNPVTYSLNGTGPSSQMRPAVKRDYRPQRAQADDFTDSSEGDGSLWANQGNSASLFTYQNDKHTGDMVIINVLENLRNQISAELKRTFPDKPVKPKAGEKKGKGEEKTAAAPAAPAAAENAETEVYDKISGTVMEEISKDYILLRGHKDVIFKKEKRSIEVQALVSRKDIMENDYVNSDKLLESRVFILNREQ